MTIFRTACQGFQAKVSAVKCLCQGHNRMARVGFEQKTMSITITALLTSQLRCRKNLEQHREQELQF